MRNFTAILHPGDPDEGGFWATCVEVRGANAQGDTKDECLEELAEAVKFMLQYQEEEALKEDPRAEKIVISIP
jgi:predicted RNase H-like HicB family nuclease